MVAVDALGRGELTAQTRLGDLLPLAGSPAGAVTLASLTTHTSGLARLPAHSDALAGSWHYWRHGTNPYGADLDTLLERARQSTVGRARAAYSNLGFMLLGHAVAAAAGTTCAALVTERLAAPLGLAGLSVPASNAELSSNAVVGTNRAGRAVEAWTGVDLGPAGGIRLSVGDLAALLSALLHETAPGMAALDPVCRFGGPASRIGAGWLILQTKAGDITWHNGGTGGFRSIVTLDRLRHKGIAIVTATARSVDRAGFDLAKPTG